MQLRPAVAHAELIEWCFAVPAAATLDTPEARKTAAKQHIELAKKWRTTLAKAGVVAKAGSSSGRVPPA